MEKLKRRFFYYTNVIILLAFVLEGSMSLLEHRKRIFKIASKEVDLDGNQLPISLNAEEKNIIGQNLQISKYDTFETTIDAGNHIMVEM